MGQKKSVVNNVLIGSYPSMIVSYSEFYSYYWMSFPLLLHLLPYFIIPISELLKKVMLYCYILLFIIL